MTSWRNINDDVVSLLYTRSIWWHCENVVYFKIHVFFLIKAFGRNIELKVK